MKTYSYEEAIEYDENADIINQWEPLEVNIDENYEYVKTGKIFSFFSNLLYYGIAIPILKVLTKIVYDLKIEGKENIKNLNSGAISVSNHVLVLDCAMVGLTYGFKKIYYTTREGSFKIPFVRKLIKLLRAIPIPSGIDNKKNFINSINLLLKNNNIVHFYPEAALRPYCEKIRNFKNGAFSFSVNNNIPVVPIVINFRNPKGIRKIFKRKKDVTLTVLEPIFPDRNILNKKECIEDLKQRVHEEMCIKMETNILE